MERMTEGRRIKNKEKVKNNNCVINRIWIIFTICMILGLLILYNPWNGFRNGYIIPVMTTRSHNYLTYIFYDENTIYNIWNY